MLRLLVVTKLEVSETALMNDDQRDELFSHVCLISL